MATLTGRTRYRVGFRKKLILQVEVKARDRTAPSYYEDVVYWRDAKLEDIDLEVVSKRENA